MAQEQLDIDMGKKIGEIVSLSCTIHESQLQLAHKDNYKMFRRHLRRLNLCLCLRQDFFKQYKKEYKA